MTNTNLVQRSSVIFHRCYFCNSKSPGEAVCSRCRILRKRFSHDELLDALKTLAKLYNRKVPKGAQNVGKG